jgi:hypothetical protein
MTTRRDLFLRVRDAVKEADTAEIDQDAPYDLVAYAAIEAVINTIGDHALAQMIGDTGERPGPRIKVENLQGLADDPFEILQDDEGDEQ